MMKRLCIGLATGMLLFAGQALAAPNFTGFSWKSVPTLDADGTYQVSWNYATTTGLKYKLEEATDAGFTTGLKTLVDKTYWYANVTGNAAGTYYYRVTAYNPLVPAENTVLATKTVEVANKMAAPTSISAPATDSDGSYTVVVSKLPTGAIYVIEESPDNSAWTEIYRGTTYYKAVKKGSAPATYYYRAKQAKTGAVAADSDYTATKSVAINMVTYQTTAQLSAANATEGAAWAASRHANTNNLGPASGSCATCHAPGGEKTAAGYGMIGCAGCHGQQEDTDMSGTAAAAINSCAKCHNSHYSASTSIVSDFAASAHATTPYAPEFGTNKCAVCHDPHTTANPTDAICSTCHTGAHVPHGGALPDCTTCHSAHDLTVPTLAVPGADISPKLSIASAHAVTGQVAVSNVDVIYPGTDLDMDGQNEVTITFDVTVDGAPATFPILFRAYQYNPKEGAANTGVVWADFTRTTLYSDSTGTPSTDVGVTYTANAGAYEVVIDKTPAAGNVAYLITMAQSYDETLPAASVIATIGGFPRATVADQVCINCHGQFVFREPNDDPSEFGHHGQNPAGVQACIVCHVTASATAPDINRDRGAKGARLMTYVHGVHNSHNMPDGQWDRRKDGTSIFSVTYPTYMTNCSVCHVGANAATVSAKPVSYTLCFSCHDQWTGFDHGNTIFGGQQHNTFTVATNCAGCHNGITAKANVGSYHNGLRTERSGLIWNGEDVSVVEGAKVDMQITGVTRVANDLKITWTAKYDTTTVNPCNATIAAGAPGFFGFAANAATGQSASNLSILLGLGQGDDWVNAGAGTAPGQPKSAMNVAAANTTCDVDTKVATTTYPLSTAEQAATRAVVALQGKAQVMIGYDFDTATAGTQNIIQVRSKTPTRELLIADGSAPSSTRREIVDTAACLKCHVGSLYQHGGNRIDNVDMCVICHNEASSEQNVRVFDGVDATEAYDGKPGQTYGFKSLLHAVHSAGENGAVTMVHRTMGNFVWAGHDTVIPRYPTQDVFGDSPVGGGVAALVYGSSAPHGTGPVTVNPNKMVYRAHNLHETTYPQALNNCVACHKPNTFGLPDPVKAVATTVDVGGVLGTQASSTGAVYATQTDDVLRGPAAAACMSCHQTNDAVRQAQLTKHANQGGFTPAASVNGRADVINGVVSESCAKCHE